jgi:hypothetical protein
MALTTWRAGCTSSAWQSSSRSSILRTCRSRRQTSSSSTTSGISSRTTFCRSHTRLSSATLQSPSSRRSVVSWLGSSPRSTTTTAHPLSLTSSTTTERTCWNCSVGTKHSNDATQRPCSTISRTQAFTSVRCSLARSSWSPMTPRYAISWSTHHGTRSTWYASTWSGTHETTSTCLQASRRAMPVICLRDMSTARKRTPTTLD